MASSGVSSDLGIAIADLRVTKKGLKQAAFARALGWHPSTLSNIENNKVCPTDEQIVRIIEVLGLKRDEAKHLLTLGYYSHSLLDRLRPDFSHYPVTEPEKVDKFLRGDLGQVPVWYLRPDATIVSFNLLSAYVWNALDIPAGLLMAEKLFDVCVFEVYARDENYSRISPPLWSHDMLYIKPLVFRRMEEDVPRTAYEAFYDRIQKSPVLKLIYECGELKGEEWEYTLRIRPPLADEEEPYLVFNVEVKRVIEKDRLEGFLVVAQPAGAYTIKAIQRVYSQIAETKAFNGQFVQRQEEPKPVVEVSYPSFYPLLTLDPFFYITSENKALQLLVQKSVVDKFLLDQLVRDGGVFRDLMGSMQANKAVLNTLRMFFSLTSETSHFRLGERYEEVRRYLFSRPEFSKHLDAFWREYHPSVFDMGPHDGIVQCEPLILCRYASNVYLRLKTVGYFHRQDDGYMLVFEPANTETCIALLLYHLEEVISPGGVGETLIDQYVWLLDVLRVIENGLAVGMGDMTWLPEQVYVQARTRTLAFEEGRTDPACESQTRHYIQGSVYELYNHKNTVSRSAMLNIFIGFCRKIGARYCYDLLTEPVTGSIIESVPSPLLADNAAQEVPHRKTNGVVERHVELKHLE